MKKKKLLFSPEGNYSDFFLFAAFFYFSDLKNCCSSRGGGGNYSGYLVKTVFTTNHNVSYFFKLFKLYDMRKKEDINMKDINVLMKWILFTVFIFGAFASDEVIVLTLKY